jgi:hypothetical protein
MKRIILVTTPGNGKTYEFTIDSGTKIHTARQAIAREIIALENGRIHLDENSTVLCSKKHQKRRDDNEFLFEGIYADDCEFLLL